MLLKESHLKGFTLAQMLLEIVIQQISLILTDNEEIEVQMNRKLDLLWVRKILKTSDF